MSAGGAGFGNTDLASLGEKAGHRSDSFYEALSMERRSCTRFADSQLILLCWEEHSANLKQLGNVADVTSGGIGVLVDRSIPVGTAVTVSRLSFLDFDLDGIVKYLSRRSDCYFIGIEFEPTNDTAALQFQSELTAA